MKTKKIFLIIFIFFILGIFIGYLISTKLIGRYNIVNATCTTINVAVENKMLNPNEIRKLGMLTKESLGDSQSKNAFKINNKRINSASEYSNCSQFIVGMNQ
ncbi:MULTISPECIES: hypothetical protein [unclassified Acinetobacter]|uniref:hypothetical protein n=1 Tax=unclassified Acinetobacter TaxID=196816 RepID=UPI002934C130|nr:MULTISPECIES: hypothetical protein [unclassified Acinetobacter]WOE33378.1 hypothetical protein QSG84_16240 [Acinetobacter sp. SAAs470]WOE36925.1 hypothetical protein QSG86_00325 [Acinetobacter sp. SAAs474]